VIALTLPWPPSVNAMWRTPTKGALAGRTLLAEAGRKYRKAVADAVLMQGKPRIGQARCAVDIEVRMPDKRRRDLDNLPKAVLDALTYAAVWNDDSQIDDLRVWRSDRSGGVVVVKVRELDLPQGVLVSAGDELDAF
jgi:crossover junction endodeoxyribonuclease RusA